MKLMRQQEAQIAGMIRRGCSYREAAKVFGICDKTAKAAAIRYKQRRRRVIPFRDRISELEPSLLEEFSRGLSEKRRIIFEVRLVRQKQMTLKALVAHCQITRQRIWQIERDLIKKLSRYA
jgi:DNA-directed RNA polymerase specialized sigma subunit